MQSKHYANHAVSCKESQKPQADKCIQMRLSFVLTVRVYGDAKKITYFEKSLQCMNLASTPGLVYW